MYCTFCGKQIADDSRFCLYCGKPVPQDYTLAALVAAARTGDKDALSALYEQTYSQVYYTVKSMIKDEDAVFDIIQDTYIKAFAHLDNFYGDTKFLPWVRQIAANTARDWLKKKRPLLFTELHSNEEQDTPFEDLLMDERSENLPEQVIDQNETKRLIREIIEELPEDQRAAIGMFYYEEMSVKEIAAAMDVSESAVKSRLMYGRGKIEKKVLELEKQGTKLYGLSPLPFLLLLFLNQKAYAVEAPNGQILETVLTLQPAGAAAAATTTHGAGTAGGIGALKLGLISLTSVAVIGLGILGVTRLISHSSASQQPADGYALIDEVSGEAVLTGDESVEADPPDDESGGTNPLGDKSEKTNPPGDEAAAPLDEAFAQYRIILSQADSYDYGKSAEADQAWLELAGYQYTLVQMQPNDPVPTLLLGKEIKDTELSISNLHIRLFQYDPVTKTLHQPTETIGDGGIRGGLSIAPDGLGLMDMWWSGGTGEGSITRITMDGDAIYRDTYWTGRIDMLPDSWALIEIEWHDIEDLSALDDWAAPASSESASSP